MKWLVVLVIIISSLPASAQYDAMFTNYMWNEMFINPGYAGSREAISTVGLLRKQWVGIEGAPMTQTISVNGPFFERQAGVGLSIMRESIGVTNQTYFLGTFAYRFKLGAGKLSFGLSGGILNKRDMLTEVNSTVPGDENFYVNTPRFNLPNASFGIYYYSDVYYIGLSVPRLINNHISPDVGEWKVENKLDPKSLHYYLTAGYVYTLGNGIRLRPTVMLKTVYGAPAEVDLSFSALFRETIWAGLAWRSGDAASLLLAYQITPNLRVGYSYDYTLTELQKTNSGSHEVCIGYDFNIGKQKIVSPRMF